MLNSWPVLQSNAITILQANPSSVEPSGLCTWTNSNGGQWIYIASDNGQIWRIPVGDTSNNWQSHTYGSGGEFDFESITNPNSGRGGTLLIGVEGGNKDGQYNYAHVKELAPSNNTTSNIGTMTNRIWKLDNYKPSVGNGMEAFTFVPQANCPADWGQPTGDFKGFFLAAYQDRPGEADVYYLPSNPGGTISGHYVKTITIDIPDPNAKKISDFFFDATTNQLFVLYDDTIDVLQQCTLSSTRATSVYAAQAPKVGCEAVMVIGNNVYIGLDQNSSQLTQNGYKNNYVFEYPNFLSCE